MALRVTGLPYTALDGDGAAMVTAPADRNPSTRASETAAALDASPEYRAVTPAEPEGSVTEREATPSTTVATPPAMGAPLL